jgi:hypothetical protein
MYQQLLKIGEGQVPCVIEYTLDDIYCVVERIWSPKREDVTGMFDPPQIEAIGTQLEAGHDSVIREMNLQARADRAADNAAFREVYA